MCFLSNQIGGFFDHHFLWVEAITIFNYLHRDGHQRKVVNETMVGCGQVCLRSNQIPGFFGYQYLWKEVIDILDFLH